MEPGIVELMRHINGTVVLVFRDGDIAMMLTKEVPRFRDPNCDLINLIANSQ